MYSTKEKASTYMSIMQEQQNSVKQLVIHNILFYHSQMKMDVGDGLCSLSGCHVLAVLHACKVQE